MESIKRKIHGHWDNLIIIIEIISASISIFKIYNCAIPKGLKRAYILARKYHFRYEESLDLGLYDPDLKEEDLSNYTSKRKLTNILYGINPKNWFWVTESKDVFYKYCMINNIPTPAIYAFFYKKSSGWVSTNECLKSKSEWLNYFIYNLPKNFVIKPARGVYGSGLELYRRDGNYLLDTNNKKHSIEELYEHMMNMGKYDSYIIQERLYNHESLTSLSGNKYLQTVRIITFVHMDGEVDILYAALKIIVGNNISDNFKMGKTGNLLAQINIQNGKLNTCMKKKDSFPGLETIDIHPDTKVKITGFIVPLWDELLSSIRNTALIFLPVRSIGWDVAITPEGPKIVEGNIRWDPPNQNAGMKSILKKLNNI